MVAEDEQVNIQTPFDKGQLYQQDMLPAHEKDAENVHSLLDLDNLNWAYLSVNDYFINKRRLKKYNL